MSDYQYDVFVSYRRNRFSLNWIAGEFISVFEERLEAELGRPPLVFWDQNSVDDGEVPVEIIKEALGTSRCLLSILSGPYFASKWCAAEWETFRERAAAARLGRGRSLTIPIQWHDGDNYLPLLRGEGPRPRDFTRFRLTGQGWRDSPRYVEYQDEINRVVESVARLVESAPPFDPQWPLVEPDAVATGSAGAWTFKLASDS
jgi:hypothetical protein